MSVQHAAFLALLTRLETRFAPTMRAEIDRFTRATADRYLAHGVINFFDLVDTHQSNTLNALKKQWKLSIAGGGQLALGRIKSRQLKDSVEDTLFEDLLQEWVSTEGLKRSHSIADTSEADVLTAISNGLDEGLGVAEIARTIRDITGLSLARAEGIAQTETHNAATYGSIESVRYAEENLDVTMEKAWAPTRDGRTRPAHAVMDADNYIPMDAKFVVGGEEMDRPGDPAGSAANTIRCRCTLLYRERTTELPLVGVR